METYHHFELEDLYYCNFFEGDSVTKRFKKEITKENAEYLHGINYYNLFLKPRSYHRICLQFIEALLEPGPKHDYKTACEVNTRIYVRREDGCWSPVPKRKFWKDQCKLLWTVWKNFVNYARPRPDYNSPLSVNKYRWSDHLMHQIDSRRKDGEFRYNPLLSVKCRRRIREIYQKHVFNKELYDKEKGKPGRKPKKPRVKAQPIQSVVSQKGECSTTNHSESARMLVV